MYRFCGWLALQRCVSRGYQKIKKECIIFSSSICICVEARLVSSVSVEARLALSVSVEARLASSVSVEARLASSASVEAGILLFGKFHEFLLLCGPEYL